VDKKQEGKKKPNPAGGAMTKELAELQGDWKVIGLETDRRKATADEVKGMRWTFQGARVRGHDPNGEEGDVGDVGEIRLDPTKDPGHFDLVAPDGPFKGKTLPGIYKLENRRLTVCLRDGKALDKGRPTEFTADAGSGQAVITLESLRDPPKPAADPPPKPADDDPGTASDGSSRTPTHSNSSGRTPRPAPR
jgi:uncharacterized protein (TIGR03067 family)